MVNPHFYLQISGSRDPQLAGELVAILKNELDFEAEVVSADRASEIPEGTRAVDPVAVASLILAIPATILTVWDLVERVQKRKKLEGVIEQIGEIAGKNPKLAVKLTFPDGRVLDIRHADPNQILDAAATAKK